ncbi:endo-1,4-beta-xylanase [Actinoplanes friuliensis]|uniref:Beta-xylanase n=1 Tax=Actinoplanes friuliensis DSM 7358 TaxID=1246995 RepID=U5VYF0_9ACTN|nr:endo-1,4-beta-xylanase [Actinoplanes friuliensis]AGZ41807.1 putative glycosyl hydrolase [Actinoplanes friuliensis DSM 7358]
MRLTRISVAALTLLATLPATVVVAGPAAAAVDPAPVTVVTSDFEDSTTQGWSARGGETVAASDVVAHGGDGSLAVTGRTATWEGPSLDLLDVVEKGTQYTFTVWVRLAAGTPADDARLSVERRTDGTASYDQVVGNTAVTADGWTSLSGRYTLATDVDFLRVYAETTTTASFHVDDFVVSYVPALPIQTDIPRIRDVVTEFPVGAAITAAETLGVHGELLARHFTSVTPGNALKWDATEPAENSFTYAQADPLLAYAKAHGLAVRGHTLVWHNQTPAWVFTGADGEPMTATAADKALLLSRLENHIRNVAAHYGDDIATWDVVNEVIDESQADGMRRSTWYEITGLDYIRTAFRVAREVAPQATLIINDYNTNVPAKRDALYDLVAQLRGEGVPIDGVGHQMHVNVGWPTIAETEAMLRKFVPLGIEQQITELDVSIYRDSTETFEVPPADRLLAQAYAYRDLFALFRRYAADITSVTLWGLADDNTWLDTFPVTRKDAPLLFDTRLQAKQAYWGVVDPSRLTPAGAPCSVAYRVTGSWPGGFQGDVRLTNTGTTPLTGWALAWSFPSGQRITQAWNTTYRQTGADVTLTNAAWNATIAPGGSVSAGFLGTWTGTNVAPDSFTLGGTTCAG